MNEKRLADDFVAQQKLAEKRGVRTIARVVAIFVAVVTVGALTGIFTRSTAGTISSMIVLGAICVFFNMGPSRARRRELVYFGQLNDKPTDYRALIVQRAPDEGAYRSAPAPEPAPGDTPTITKWTD